MLRTCLFSILFLLSSAALWRSLSEPSGRSGGAALPGIVYAAGQENQISSLIGKPAPAFTLEDLQGHKVSLSDYKGKAVLINFWATWCGPCRLETPWLIELRQQYAAKGFEILGLSADDIDRRDPAKLTEEKRLISRSATQMHIPYPVLIDAGALGNAYGELDSLPESFFVDRNGIVVAVQSGLTSKSEIEAKVLRAMSEGSKTE